MYVAQAVSDRIKLQAKIKGVSLKTMLPDIGLGINKISQLSNGTEISSFSLAKIADYLDCSVDYLLCRTENPNSHNTHAGDITISPYEDRQLASIIKIYEQLDDVGKAKLLIAADEINGRKD